MRKPAQNDKNGIVGLKPDLPYEVGVRQVLGRTCRSIGAFASGRFRRPPTLARPSSNVNNQSVSDTHVLGIPMPKAKWRLPTSAAQPIEVCRYSNRARTASTITPIADGRNGDTLLTLSSQST